MNRAALALAGLIAATYHAQTKVYKCTANGRTTYSDEPCIGATAVDVTPTRGLDTMTGKPVHGRDVKREHQQEAIADALKPLGVTREQFKDESRRAGLTPDAKRACASLDRDLQRIADESDLYRARKQYKDLKC